MDPGFDVSPPDLASAGQALDSAADQASEVDVAAALTMLGGALPGSASAAAASGFTRAWEPTFTSWVEGVRTHAAALTTTADGYITVDDAVRDSMVGMDGVGR